MNSPDKGYGWGATLGRQVKSNSILYFVILACTFTLYIFSGISVENSRDLAILFWGIDYPSKILTPVVCLSCVCGCYVLL